MTFYFNLKNKQQRKEQAMSKCPRCKACHTQARGELRTAGSSSERAFPCRHACHFGSKHQSQTEIKALSTKGKAKRTRFLSYLRQHTNEPRKGWGQRHLWPKQVAHSQDWVKWQCTVGGVRPRWVHRMSTLAATLGVAPRSLVTATTSWSVHSADNHLSIWRPRSSHPISTVQTEIFNFIKY